MSDYSIDYLNKFTRIGFTEKRGNAWHWRQGTTNHFEGPVPIEEVQGLFAPWKPVKIEGTGAFTGEYVYAREDLLIDQFGNDFNTVSPELIDPEAKICATSESHQAHEYTEWLITNVANMLDDEVQIGSAGVLKHGAAAWVQVELPQTWEVEGVAFRPNILATTSLDQSLRSLFKPTETIVVCDNTMKLGLSEATPFYSVKHTKNSTFKVEEARKRTGLVLTQQADAFAKEVQALVGTKVTDQQFDNFLDEIAPIPDNNPRVASRMTNKQDLFRNMWNSDPRVAVWKNTVWGVYQLMNTYQTHERTFRDGVNPIESTMLAMVSGERFKDDAKTLSKIQQVLNA